MQPPRRWCDRPSHTWDDDDGRTTPGRRVPVTGSRYNDWRTLVRPWEVLMTSYPICEGGSLGDKLAGRTKRMRQEVSHSLGDSKSQIPRFVQSSRARSRSRSAFFEKSQIKTFAEVDLTRSVRGERMTVTVPATGAVDLLHLRPMESFMGQPFPCIIDLPFPIKGGTRPNTIVWTLEDRTIDTNRFNSWWAEELSAMQKQIGFLNTEHRAVRLVLAKPCRRCHHCSSRPAGRPRSGVERSLRTRKAFTLPPPVLDKIAGSHLTQVPAAPWQCQQTPG